MKRHTPTPLQHSNWFDHLHFCNTNIQWLTTSTRQHEFSGTDRVTPDWALLNRCDLDLSVRTREDELHIKTHNDALKGTWILRLLWISTVTGEKTVHSFYAMIWSSKMHRRLKPASKGQLLFYLWITLSQCFSKFSLPILPHKIFDLSRVIMSKSRCKLGVNHFLAQKNSYVKGITSDA